MGSKRKYPNHDQVNVAIIGYGGAFNMGRRHGQSMQMTGKMKVVAVCDIDQDRAAVGKEDFPEAEIHTDSTTMLAKVKPDLCTVILPHNLHAPIAIQCLEAGAHVVVEKPMCLNVAEADAMIGAADKAKKMVSVFHNRRWDGDFVTMREIVREQKLIGDVYHVEMYGGGYSKPREWWRSYKNLSGGLFYDWGAHYLDWLLQIVPEEITGVTGFFHKLKWMDYTNEDNVEAAIRFANGAVAHVQWSTLAMVGKERWRVLGTEGSVLSGPKAYTVKCLHEGHQATLEIPYKESAWDAYYANVAAHLCDGDELIIDPVQARKVISVIETAEKSSEAGVTLPLA